jgi:hypothetical protein
VLRVTDPRGREVHSRAMAKAVEVELEDLASWLGLAAVESHAGVATPPLTVPRSQRVGSRRPREPGTGSRTAEPERIAARVSRN